MCVRTISTSRWCSWHSAFRRMRVYSIGNRHFDNGCRAIGLAGTARIQKPYPRYAAPVSEVAGGRAPYRRISIRSFGFSAGYIRRVTIARRLVRSNPKRVGSTYGRFHAHRRGQQ
jgi:hypothetical protein